MVTFKWDFEKTRATCSKDDISIRRCESLSTDMCVHVLFLVKMRLVNFHVYFGVRNNLTYSHRKKPTKIASGKIDTGALSVCSVHVVKISN